MCTLCAVTHKYQKYKKQNTRLFKRRKSRYCGSQHWKERSDQLIKLLAGSACQAECNSFQIKQTEELPVNERNRGLILDSYLPSI